MNLKNWSERLIWATVLVTIVRYSAAFMASDVGVITGFSSEVITFFLTLTGLGMGILDTVGGGLLFNGWSKVYPKNGQKWSLRFKVLTLCVVTLIVSGLIILVPFTMSRLASESVLDALGGKESYWSWVWATMVNLIPYVLIAGVFVGNKVVTSMDEESSGNSSGSNTKVVDVFRNSSGNSSGSKTGRKPIHQERVFEYMEKYYSETGEIASFTEVANETNLPQSTASRLRNEWIQSKRV